MLGVGLWLSLAVETSSNAASFALSEQDRDDAIQFGKRSVISEDFGSEWRVDGDGVGKALTVITPFHRLALAARNSSFKSQELKQKDIDGLLKEQEGSLTLWATLKGGQADFARFYTPVLMNGPQQIKASFAQNERTARREDDGSFTARCVYVFGADGLRPKDTVVLIVKDVDDKQVAKFTVDLSAMR
jgi:hypothetical protein